MSDRMDYTMRRTTRKESEWKSITDSIPSLPGLSIKNHPMGWKFCNFSDENLLL